MASKWVFIGGVENAHPLQELIAQKPYWSRVNRITSSSIYYKQLSIIMHCCLVRSGVLKPYLVPLSSLSLVIGIVHLR